MHAIGALRVNEDEAGAGCTFDGGCCVDVLHIPKDDCISIFDGAGLDCVERDGDVRGGCGPRPSAGIQRAVGGQGEVGLARVESLAKAAKDVADIVRGC